MKNKDNKNNKWLIASKIIDVILYIALIITIIFWQIYPSLFENLTVGKILVSILILFGTCWLHVIESITEINKHFSRLDTTDVMQYNFLNPFLDEIKEKKSIIKELKIIDISAVDFLYLFSQDKTRVKDCTLLLRDFSPNSSDYNQKTVDEIEHSIEKWMSLKNSGRIENLNIIRYTNAHSNFFCIVDNEIILAGFQHNEPIRENPDVMLVDITSRKGYQLIQQYVKEFNFILQSVASQLTLHNGNGNIIGYSNIDKNGAKNKLKRELSRAKTVSAVGLACTEITSLSLDELHTILVNNNGCIKVMFMDPDKEEIKFREKTEHGDDITEYQFPSIVKYNRNRFLENVKKIKSLNNFPEDWKQVYIGKYNVQPSINCIMTDEYVFVHYYGMKHCGMDTPIFVINKNMEPEIYEYYKNYIEEYWKIGESYD